MITSAVHKYKHTIKHELTLSHSVDVCCVDIRPTEDITAAILLVGLENGDVHIYRTPFSHTQPLQFRIFKRFHAHQYCVFTILMHPTKPLFLTVSNNCILKIWRFAEVADPLLVKRIEHPDYVNCAKYTPSGLLVTGCADGVLRVYSEDPLYSLRWSCQLGAEIVLVACSPSNNIAAAFCKVKYHHLIVQVWDSTFHTLFEHKERSVFYLRGMSFASDDLLVGCALKYLYLYNISESKATVHTCPDYIPSRIATICPEIVCTSSGDEMLRVYKVHGNELRLLATCPHEMYRSLASCVYPYNDAGYILVSALHSSGDVHISVASRFDHWVREVAKILFNTKILPFCRDVDKIILKYLRF